MKWRLVGAAAFIGALCASPASASCLKWDSASPSGWSDVGNAWRSIPVEAEFQRAFMVVTGEVRSLRRLPNADDFVLTKYEVVPVETFKGPKLDAFTLVDDNDSGRFPMEVGKSYLLFVSAVGKRSKIDSCGWSDEMQAAAETLRRVKSLAAR